MGADQAELVRRNRELIHEILQLKEQHRGQVRWVGHASGEVGGACIRRGGWGMGEVGIARVIVGVAHMT